jgi:glycerophosphoryl diester phosphodiesterase
MKHNNTLPDRITASGNPPYIIAHRGCRELAPENSIASFDLALEQGAHAIETDLHITKDRQIVCFHDETVDRMTDGSGRIAEMTLDELRQLVLVGGSGTDNFPTQRIPTLDEVFTRYKGRAYFLLELKAPSWTHEDDIDLLREIIERHGMQEEMTLASFGHDILDAVRRYAPELYCGPISLFNLMPPKQYPFVGVWYPSLFLNPLYVWMCHRRGQFFAPLDPTPEARLRYYVWLGCDFVLTDNPAKTIAKLQQIHGQ